MAVNGGGRAGGLQHAPAIPEESLLFLRKPAILATH